MSIDVTKQGKVKPALSRQHAIIRARERYNLNLSMIDIERVEFRIRQKDSDVFFLDKTSRKRSVWLARVENVMVVVVYNNAQKCIATFLPVWYAKRYLNGDSEWNPNYECED